MPTTKELRDAQISAEQEAAMTDHDAAVETSVVNSLSDLIGREHSEIVATLRKRKDYTDNAGMRVTNITMRTADEDSAALSQMTVVVNKPLPVYIKAVSDEDIARADENGRVKSTSKNIFVAAFQLASVLKQIGETAFANAISTNPAKATAILEGARVSVLTREYAAGETEFNPFASTASEYVFENNTVRHYLYDIKLGSTGLAIKQEMIRALALQMLG